MAQNDYAAVVEVVVFEDGSASLSLFAKTPGGPLFADCNCPEEDAGETVDLLLDLPADGTEDPTHA